MEIRADRRRLHLDPDAGLVQDVRVAAQVYLDAKLRVAKHLAAIEKSRDFLAYGQASAADFARIELGIPRRDIPLLLDLGRSLGVPAEVSVPAESEDQADRERDGAHDDIDDGAQRGPNGDDTPSGGDGHDDRSGATAMPPTVEQRVRDQRLSIENAAHLGRLLRKPGIVAAADHARWVHAAETTPAWKFGRLVSKAIEEAAQAEPTVYLGLRVTENARNAFRRARDLASRRAGRVLTEGQTFALVVTRYVASEDKTLRGTKKRRVGPTGDQPGRRYVPAEVEHAVRARANDRCEVPGCSNGAYVQLMHVGKSHAAGGGREVHDLALGCTTHHVLLDAGVIRFAGWDNDNHPRFRAADGRLLGESPPASGCAVDAADGTLATRLDESSLAHSREPDKTPSDASRRAAAAHECACEIVERTGGGEASDGQSPEEGPIDAAHAAPAEPCDASEADWDVQPDSDQPGSDQVAERPPPWGSRVSGSPPATPTDHTRAIGAESRRSHPSLRRVHGGARRPCRARYSASRSEPAPARSR